MFAHETARETVAFTPYKYILTDKRNATDVTLRNSCNLNYLFQNKFD